MSNHLEPGAPVLPWCPAHRQYLRSCTELGRSCEPGPRVLTLEELRACVAEDARGRL